MPNKTQIAEWRALALAVELRDAGMADTSLESIARTVAFERDASRTAVPAMADMLERAMDALAVAESQSNSCPWCRSWLVWPSGPHTDDCLIGQLLAEYNA